MNSTAPCSYSFLPKHWPTRGCKCASVASTVLKASILKQVFILAHNEARRRALAAVSDAPDGFCVTVSEPTRNLDQNARLWASLSEISKQVEWYGKKLTPEDWKHIFTSSLRKLEVVPNLDGSGFVALGLSTSKMSKRELSDLLELIYAFGSERNVIFKE